MPHPIVYCCLAASASFFCAGSVNADAGTSSTEASLKDKSGLGTAELNVRTGAAFFVHARSLALEHQVKPSLRASAWFPALDAIDLGGGISGILTSSSNYGVWAAYALGRYRLIDDGFRLSAMLGLGVGHNAPILHSDLKRSALLLPYLSVGVEAMFPLSEDIAIGVELADEQISVLHLGASLSIRL